MTVNALDIFYHLPRANFGIPAFLIARTSRAILLNNKHF